MPLTRKPIAMGVIAALKDYITGLGQPDMNDSVEQAQIKGGLSGMAEGAMNVLEPDPVMSLLNPMMTGPAMPLISIFKNKAAREAATEVFKQKGAALNNPLMQQASEEFAARYPRVAAHMAPRDSGPSKLAGAFVNPPAGRIREPIDMGITPLGSHNTKTYEKAQNYMYHEGAHAAQALGNRHFVPLYNASQDAVGYAKNPFEINANAIAARKMANPTIAPPLNASKQLETIASGVPEPFGDLIMSQDVHVADPRRLIQMILDHRAKK